MIPFAASRSWTERRSRAFPRCRYRPRDPDGPLPRDRESADRGMERDGELRWEGGVVGGHWIVVWWLGTWAVVWRGAGPSLTAWTNHPLVWVWPVSVRYFSWSAVSCPGFGSTGMVVGRGPETTDERFRAIIHDQDIRPCSTGVHCAKAWTRAI